MVVYPYYYNTRRKHYLLHQYPPPMHILILKKDYYSRQLIRLRYQALQKQHPYHVSSSLLPYRMAVDFPQCVVPDTFREGMGITVVVEGRLAADGTFHASQVIPRCPSRYEMDERAGRGETMPHALPPAVSPTPR